MAGASYLLPCTPCIRLQGQCYCGCPADPYVYEGMRVWHRGSWVRAIAVRWGVRELGARASVEGPYALVAAT